MSNHNTMAHFEYDVDTAVQQAMNPDGVRVYDLSGRPKHGPLRRLNTYAKMHGVNLHHVRVKAGTSITELVRQLKKLKTGMVVVTLAKSLRQQEMLLDDITAKLKKHLRRRVVVVMTPSMALHSPQIIEVY